MPHHGAAHAPIAVMLMVAEMTGNLTLLAPAMIAVAVCTVVVGDATISTSQANTRSDSSAHHSRLPALPRRTALLIEQRVREALSAWSAQPVRPATRP